MIRGTPFGHARGFGRLGAYPGHPAYFGASGDAGIRALQEALAVLGAQTGDAALLVDLDGLLGPATTHAVNVAMAQYAKAPAALATGKLTIAQVRANAAALTAAIRSAANGVVATPSGTAATRAQIQALQTALRTLGARTGDNALAITADGVVGPQTRAAVAHAISRYSVVSPTGGAPTGPQLGQAAVVTAITTSVQERAAGIAKPVAPAPSTPTRSPTVERLQNALVALGRARGDNALAKIKVDGLSGPETVGAVARALGETMSAADVVANAEVLARRVEDLVRAGGATVPSVPVDAPKGSTKRSPVISEIQQLLNWIGAHISDPALVVVVDGIVGPATTAAINRYQRTSYSVAAVAANADKIAADLREDWGLMTHRVILPAQPPPEPEPDPGTDAEEGGDGQPEAPPFEPQLPTPTNVAPALPREDDGDVPSYTPPDVQQTLPEEPAIPEYIPPGAQLPAPPMLPPSPFVTPGEALAPPVPDQPAVQPALPDLEAKKPFPWIWVAGGVLAAAGIGGAIFLMSKPGVPAQARASRPRGVAPARRRSPAFADSDLFLPLPASRRKQKRRRA